MSKRLPSKQAIVAALSAQLDVALAGVEASAAMARDEVASDETRSEGKYDTRATEASYLARGQAMRITSLRRLAAWFEVFDPVAPLDPPVVQVGALVALEGARAALVFVAPVGGLRAEVEGWTVEVVSPRSPLGVAMEELEVDDGFEVDSPRGIVEYEIVALK